MKIKIKKVLKRLLITIFVCFLSLVAIILYADWRIMSSTKDYIYDSADSIPKERVALVLGTTPSVGCVANPYFTYRIDAAQELYSKGVVQRFVLSGDNKHESYNEPRYMMKALIKAGIPDSILYLDFAGFRTLDSVVRIADVFQQKSFIIVSQKFHNERAIFLARYYGLEAYGYNAKDLPVNRFSIKTKIREKLARVKVFIDILINKEPKFLGDPIDIE